jgi:hypothetical protein
MSNKQPAKTGKKQGEISRSKGGLFKKGYSGNPNGRPAGSRHRASTLAESLIDGQSQELVNKCIEMALEGDTIALRLCLERLLPPRKTSPINIKVPRMNNTIDLPKATGAIVNAVAEGKIDPTTGEIFSRVIERHIKAVEVADFEQRLQVLEEQQR